MLIAVFSPWVSVACVVLTSRAVWGDAGGPDLAPLTVCCLPYSSSRPLYGGDPRVQTRGPQRRAPRPPNPPQPPAGQGSIGARAPAFPPLHSPSRFSPVFILLCTLRCWCSRHSPHWSNSVINPRKATHPAARSPRGGSGSQLSSFCPDTFFLAVCASYTLCKISPFPPKRTGK